MVSNTADPTDTTSKHRLKILVVDDDEMSSRLMRLLLIRDNHDIQVVSNGIEALDAVKEQRFDVVFMDLQMPVMDGLEASRRIREWENGNFHTYIVALTASYLPEQGSLLFEAGIDNYISKPFELENIRRLLDVIAKSEYPIAMPNFSFTESNPARRVALDIQKGTQQVGGDLKTYKELLSDFVRDLPDRIRNLERFSNERDMTSLARAAHNLKGVASNLGAWELADYAAKLDKQSNEGYTDQYLTLILDLKRAETDLQKIATDFLTKDKIVASA